MMATTKAGIGEVVKAYLECDRSTGAFAERERLLAKGLDAKAEHEALLDDRGEAGGGHGGGAVRRGRREAGQGEGGPPLG